MDREGASSSLHELITGAVNRAADVQEDSRLLIAECHVVSVALRETVDALHRRRDDRAATRPDG